MSNNIPDWKVFGDWFDVCKCSIPCPCEFAQTPSYGDCDAVTWHIMLEVDFMVKYRLTV